MIADYPDVGDVWRVQGRLVRVVMTQRKPLGEAIGGLSVGGSYDEGHITLRTLLGEEREWVEEWPILRAEGVLIYLQNPPQDGTLDALEQGAADARDLREVAAAIRVLERDGRARALESALSTSVLLAELIAADRRLIRRREHEASLRALNDLMGIANCDHLIMDPECPECTKEPTGE